MRQSINLSVNQTLGRPLCTTCISSRHNTTHDVYSPYSFYGTRGCRRSRVGLGSIELLQIVLSLCFPSFFLSHASILPVSGKIHQSVPRYPSCTLVSHIGQAHSQYHDSSQLHNLCHARSDAFHDRKGVPSQAEQQRLFSGRDS